MSGDSNTAGQVLGSTAAIAGGIGVLPATGSNTLGIILCAISITCGTLVILTLITTRLIRRFAK